MLGIPEASRFYIAEMGQMNNQLILNVQLFSSPWESLVENAQQ